MTYAELRQQLRTGDVILWSGRGILPWIIRWRTGSPYTHASLVVRPECFALSERVLLVEALEHGLTLRLLSERIAAERCRAWALKAAGLTNVQRNGIVAFALDRLAQGKRYDYRALLACAIERPAYDEARYICSEWALAAHVHAAGLPRPERCPRPDDLPRLIPGQLVEIEDAARLGREVAA